MRKSNTFTHNHNCLMVTITFKVYPITPISPRNTLATIFKAFWFFLLLFFFAYFSFKQIMHEHIRERKEIPNYVKLLILHFCYAEVYICHFMIGWQHWWDGYLYLSLRIFQSFLLKRVVWVLGTRDYLILLITNTNHKAHLLSCA